MNVQILKPTLGFDDHCTVEDAQLSLPDVDLFRRLVE